MNQCITYLLGSLLLLSPCLNADNDSHPGNVVYLIPDGNLEYITKGRSIVVENTIIQQMDCNVLHLKDIGNQFGFRFEAPYHGTLKPGKYEKAKKIGSYYNPGLEVYGPNEKYSEGEFEIFEIQYEGQRVLSFAANFTAKGKSDILKGTIRFNSSYPIDDYFITMSDPAFKWDAKELVYINKYGEDPSTALIAIDRTKININWNDAYGMNIIVKTYDKCFSEIYFHFPVDTDFSTDKSFVVHSFSSSDKPQLYIENYFDRKITVKNGQFTLLGLSADFITKKITSLAINFKFIQDDVLYEGIIRYHSDAPLKINFFDELPYFEERDIYDYEESSNYEDSDYENSFDDTILKFILDKDRCEEYFYNSNTNLEEDSSQYSDSYDD